MNPTASTQVRSVVSYVVAALTLALAITLGSTDVAPEARTEQTTSGVVEAGRRAP